MISNEAKQTLSNIVRGIIITEQCDNLNSARNFLCESFATNTTIAKNIAQQTEIKKKQIDCLKSFITENNLWISNFPNLENYLTEGGEAKIYFGIDNKSVIKLNDGIYYSTWLDFFNSLLIHNTFFRAISYELIGFKLLNNILYAVLQQPFVISDDIVDLEKVSLFLAYNGFIKKRRNDYYNEELGLVLEDIHDENVLINANTLFFIDTVFYIDLKE